MQNTKISLLSSLLDSNFFGWVIFLWLHAPAHHINPVNLDQQWLRFVQELTYRHSREKKVII